jgi:hypothetical protein
MEGSQEDFVNRVINGVRQDFQDAGVSLEVGKCIFCTVYLYRQYISVLRIRDVYTGSRIRIFPLRIQDQKDIGSVSKNLSSFNPKHCFLAFRKMICDFQTGSSSEFFSHPGSRAQKSIGHGSVSATLSVNVLAPYQ